VAQEYPELKIILAHLGVCWGEEAATLCRIHKNVYADLSGKVDGWMSSKPVEWFREMFFWRDAHKKILFGSDVHCDELEETLLNQTKVFRELGWGGEQIDRVFSVNARELFRF
jgi:predicted TIM-barrel fold metal-dependent hydrolase